MNATTSAAANGDEGLADKLHHMVDEVDLALKSATQSGDQKFDAVREELVERVRRLRTQLGELQETALVKAKDAARTTDQAVHEHPYSAMGVAAALGLLIGFLAARR